MSATFEQPTPVVDGPRVQALNARTLMWSIRREIWENRSVYIAPICAALLVLLGFSISAAKLAPYGDHFAALNPDDQKDLLRHLLMPTAAIIMGTSGIVSFFYCLDALYTERRDRSILFWKSLPVSDVETVLSKIAIPVLVIPLLSFIVIAVTQLILLASISLILVAHGVSAAGVTGNISLVQLWSSLLYGECIAALWFAPVFGWLLLVSAWAQRLPFLWAVLPPFGLAILEYLSFRTSYVWNQLGERLLGVYVHGFYNGSLDPTTSGGAWQGSIAAVPDPVSFFATPGLWIGLVVALVFVAASVWIRRYREAI
jgi:ABC-2 type transport system permease protein